MENGHGRVRRALSLLFRALAAALAVLACVALWRSGLLSDLNALRAVISRSGPLAWLAFFILQMLTVIVAPIPSNVTMMAGALALGFVRAFVLGVLAILCGSLVVFFAARRLGQGAVRRLIDRGLLERYLPLIEEKQDMFLFLTLLFPFFPDDMLCILAGLSSIPAKRFTLILIFSRPWGLVFAALVGSGVLRLPAWGWGLLAAASAALFVAMMTYSARIEAALLRLISRVTRGRKAK